MENKISSGATKEENEKYIQKIQDKANHILNEFKGYEIQEALSILEVTKGKLESLQRRTII